MRQLSDSELENISGGGKKTFVICSIGIFSIGLLLKFTYDVRSKLKKLATSDSECFKYGFKRGVTGLVENVEEWTGLKISKSRNIYDRAVDHAVDSIIDYAVHEYEKDKESNFLLWLIYYVCM